MSATLNISVQANTKKAAADLSSFARDASKGLGAFDAATTAAANEFIKLQKAISRTTDPRAITVYQKRLSELGDTLRSKIPPAAQTAETALNKLGKNTGQANVALINFGRVVQDAPFGIIGIANNIDPLLQSFQQLKKETGSSSAAFKALGSTLLGPAGIAVGVSALTSALIAFGPQISAAITGVSKFDAALKTAGTEGAKAFAEATNEFGKFSATLNNANASANQQKVALEGVNGILGEYGLKIKSVADFQKVGAQVGAIYAQITEKEARATALASAAADEYVTNIQRLNSTTKAVSSITAGGALKQIFDFAKLGPGGLLALGGSLEKIGKSEGLQKKFADETAKLRTETDTLVKSLENLNGVVTDGKIKTATTDTEKLVSAQELLNAAWDKAIGEQLDLKKGYNGLTGAAGLFLDELQKINEEQNKAAEDRTRNVARQFITPGTISGAGRGPSSSALDSLNESLKKAEALSQRAIAIRQSIADGINSIATEGTAAIAESFAGLITGNGSITDGIRAFAAVVGSAVSALGKQIIAVSTTMQALQKALASGIFAGPVGIAAGLALVVAGAALRNLVTEGPKLATGGVVNGPTRALIGEGGPEAVIPLSQMARILGNDGNGGNVVVTGRLSGQQLYITNQRGGQSYSRLFR